MQEKKPVLIFAQSGRFLAESATQAGHIAWVADCFGDTDTLTVADRYQPLPPLNELKLLHLQQALISLSQGQDCVLICGSGIEKFYPILSLLPPNIQYLGNTENTIATLKTPSLFFALLQRLNLPFPETVFTAPKKNHSGWIIKKNSGLGGSHIKLFNGEPAEAGFYYQRYIKGKSGSILFISNGEKAITLQTNEQYCLDNLDSPFQLAAIEAPVILSSEHETLLNKAIASITKETGLIGLNSLDFIIDAQQNLYLLEINPRPSASCELLHKGNLFKAHILSCQNNLPTLPPHSSYTNTIGLYYLYAPKSVIIPDNITWPTESHDHPQANSVIKQGDPICTLVITAKTHQQCQQQHRQLSTTILQQMT
jgi:predicted ATP-grasp superfamily ATP-dependent carboligase